MFCGRNLNNQINCLHERSLRIVYNDYESSFQELFELDNSVSILAIELFQVKNGLSNRIMSELFDFRNIEDNLRSQKDFLLEHYTTNYGLWSLRYLAPKIWNVITADIRMVVLVIHAGFIYGK